MANLPESPVWEDGIYQYEITDPLQSGPDGIDNLQGKQLANRTAYLKAQVDHMKGRGGYLTAHDFGTNNPTQQALTDYALTQIGQTDPLLIWDKTHVKNLKNGHVWVLVNTPETEPAIFEWVDDGQDSVGVGDNNGIAGIVSGGEGFDEVYIQPDGKMKVKGFSAVKALHAMEADGSGRNILDVLGVSTIAEAMAELRRRCNNSGEIDNTKIPDFSGLMIGDYIDGLDFSGVAAPTNGTAPQAWNDTYKNNRIIIAGFNTYKSAGSTENAKNHVLFVFKNIVAKGRMNATDTNTGGYAASELRTWLEGANGDGSGTFATALKAALGGNYLYTVSKYHSRKGSSEAKNYTVFLPTEVEFFGNQTYGDELNYYNTNVHFPIYQRSTIHRVKRWNGARDWHWLHTPSASSSSYFCYCYYYGFSNYYNYASEVGGVAPAFCVA